MDSPLIALNQLAATESRPPEWAGWLGLLALLTILGLVAWWLFASPMRGGMEQVSLTRDVLRMRFRMALVVLLSFVLLRAGASWDELWHRRYGLPFGEDLLWPPHLLMYASFVLNVAMVVFGLSVALQGRGSLRARFRRDPLLAMLGLLSAFGFAFIPVDVIWHQVIGPDLTAASPPHVVGALSGSAVALVGVALALSTASRQGWQRFTESPRGGDFVALGILAMLALNWLQLLTTEWDWANRVAESRPAWIYSVIVGVVGVTFSQLALHATRRIGAATSVALVDLALHAVAVAAFRIYLPPGPAIAAHVVLLPAAVALDIWYAARVARSSDKGWTLLTETGAGILYATVLLAALIPYASLFMHVPVFDPTSVLLSLVTTVPSVVLASLACARLGEWLGSVGRAQTPAADGVRPPEISDSRGARAGSRELVAR
jgi:uncharacterized membrane protein YdcZ (DUF606 family)